MKTRLLAASALISLLHWNATAEVLLTESFTYPDGPLVGAEGSPWVVNYPGTNATPVVNRRLFLTQSEEESVRFDIDPYLNTGSVYARFQVTFTELPAGAGNYFAFYRQAGVDNLRGRLWVSTSGAATGKFRLGCVTIGSGPSMIPADLSLNTPYTLVLRYNITNYTTTLWINPTSENDTTLRADYIYDSTLGNNVGHFGFKQVADYESKANGMGSLYVDDLRLGTSFYDVQPEPTLTSIVHVAANQVELSGVGIPITNYIVLATTNLASGQWIPLGNATADTDGSLQFTDTSAGSLPYRFYRLLSQ